MKHVILLVAAAMLVAGCQQSLDQKFEAMCSEQKRDPDAPRMGEEQCADPGNVSEDTKGLVVDTYRMQRERSNR